MRAAMRSVKMAACRWHCAAMTRNTFYNSIATTWTSVERVMVPVVWPWRMLLPVAASYSLLPAMTIEDDMNMRASTTKATSASSTTSPQITRCDMDIRSSERLSLP